MVVGQGEVWWADLPSPTERIAKLSKNALASILSGIDIILAR